jgi:hypothetical protein
MARPGPAVLIARPAAVCARLRLGAIGRVSRASAAGITWTSRTAKAQWGRRGYHTSVVDAAGAIYVIGGTDTGSSYFHDVWASTDGGARAGLMGYSGYRGYYRGTKGYLGYLVVLGKY